MSMQTPRPDDYSTQPIPVYQQSVEPPLPYNEQEPIGRTALPSNRWLVLISVGSWAVILLIVTFLSAMPLPLGLFLWIVLSYASYRYLRDVRRLEAKRVLVQWQKDVVPDNDGMRVSGRSFDLLRYLLDVKEHDDDSTNPPSVRIVREDRVEWVTRYHWMKLLVRTGPSALACLVLLAAIFTGLTIISGTLSLVVAALLAVVLLIPLRTAIVTALRWRYSFLMVTNLNIWRVTIKPTWLPYMNGDQPNIPRRRVILTDPQDSGFFANLFGYGALSLDTQSDKDEPFQLMRYLAEHEAIALKVRRKM